MQNKDNVLETLNEYISNLNAFKEKLEAEAVEELLADMKDINRIKSILKQQINTTMENKPENAPMAQRF